MQSNSAKHFSKIPSWYPRFFKHILKHHMFILNMKCDKFIHGRHSTSPLRNPLFVPGDWHEWKFKYWKVSISLKYIWMSRVNSLLKFAFVHFCVKNIISKSDNSANSDGIMVQWTIAVFQSYKFFSFALGLFHKQKMLSMYLFQINGFVVLWVIKSIEFPDNDSNNCM